MKTKTKAFTDVHQLYYLLKCPHCGTELVVAHEELNKQLFEPVEVEEMVDSFSIGDKGEFIDNGKVKHKDLRSSDSSKDVYKDIKCCYCGHVWDEFVKDMYEKRCNCDGQKAITFELDEKETLEAKDFISKHRHKEDLKARGKLAFSTLGQQFTYTFIPGGLGDCKIISCNFCGETKDITNTDNW